MPAPLVSPCDGILHFSSHQLTRSSERQEYVELTHFFFCWMELLEQWNHNAPVYWHMLIWKLICWTESFYMVDINFVLFV